jgi:hypothetical protein
MGSPSYSQIPSVSIVVRLVKWRTGPLDWTKLQRPSLTAIVFQAGVTPSQRKVRAQVTGGANSNFDNRRALAVELSIPVTAKLPRDEGHDGGRAAISAFLFERPDGCSAGK